MSIQRASAKPTTTPKAAEGDASERKGKAKKLLLKLGVMGATGAVMAATGGAGLAAGVISKVGAKVAPKLAGAISQIAARVPGRVGEFLATKGTSLAATGGTATAGGALASSLSAVKGASLAKDVNDVVEA